jgi:hypothetical protein
VTRRSLQPCLELLPGFPTVWAAFLLRFFISLGPGQDRWGTGNPFPACRLHSRFRAEPTPFLEKSTKIIDQYFLGCLIPYSSAYDTSQCFIQVPTSGKNKERTGLGVVSLVVSGNCSYHQAVTNMWCIMLQYITRSSYLAGYSDGPSTQRLLAAEPRRLVSTVSNPRSARCEPRACVPLKYNPYQFVRNVRG